MTLRLVDGLPHTFFNRSDLDELAGPFRMTVRDRARGAAERRSEDRAGVFAVAREFSGDSCVERRRHVARNFSSRVPGADKSRPTYGPVIRL